MAEAGHGTDASGPRASFWLVPGNPATGDAVNSYAAWNEGFTDWYKDPEDPGKQILALRILFYGYDAGQAVSVGRQSQSSSDRVANIVLPPEKHSSDRPRQQCDFRFNSDTGAVVLRDLTSREHVRVTANRWQKEVPFSVEHGGGRQVVISRDFNGRLSMGKNSDLVFIIDWELDALYTWFDIDDIHVGPRENDQYRYVQGNDIGSGSYGTVFKAVDVYTGKAMAVKRYRGLEGRRRELAWREVTHLKSLRHKHILSILDIESGPSWMEMFMPLMDGSLKDLILYHSSQFQLDIEHVATRVLYQMLQALEFLHSGTSQRPVVIHRDIKPANILYRWRHDNFGYDFFLADFGVAHLASLATTENVGTQAYRAPEVAIVKGRQTPMVDIWSLFVTIAWVWNDDNFQDKCEGSTSGGDSTVTEIAELPRYRKLRNMVQLKPENRPTASYLLSSLRPDRKTQTFPGLWKWAGQESGDDSGFSDDYVRATGSNDYAPDRNSSYPQQTAYPEGHDTGYGGDTTGYGASGYYDHASSAGDYPGYDTNPGAAASGYYPYMSGQYGAGSSAPRYVGSGSGQAADPAMAVTGGMNSLTLGDYNQFDAGPSAGSSSGPQHRTESRDDRKASKGKKKSSSTRR